MVTTTLMLKERGQWYVGNPTKANEFFKRTSTATELTEILNNMKQQTKKSTPKFRVLGVLYFTTIFPPKQRVPLIVKNKKHKILTLPS